MDLNLWLAFVAASTLLLLIPGPTILLVIFYSMSQGKKVALSVVAGVALGDFIAMTASLAGLGALVLASAQLFILIKWIGALYLIYLGIQMLRGAKGAGLPVIEKFQSKKSAKIFWHGVLVTALNPKGIVFFIAFVPQFIDVNGALGAQFSILIATFVGLGAINAFLYAMLAAQMKEHFLKPATLPWISRLGGTTLIAMGASIAAFRKASA